LALVQFFDDLIAGLAEDARQSPSSPAPEQSPEIAAAIELAPPLSARHQADSVFEVESGIATSPSASLTTPAQNADVVVEASGPADGRLRDSPRSAPDGAPAPASSNTTASGVTAPAPEVPPPSRKRPCPPRVSTFEEMVAHVETHMVAHEILPALLPSRPEPGSPSLVDQRQRAATAGPVRETHARQQPPPPGPRQMPDRATPENMASKKPKQDRKHTQVPTTARQPSTGHPTAKKKRFWPRIRKNPDRDRD